MFVRNNFLLDVSKIPIEMLEIALENDISRNINCISTVEKELQL